jgi:tetratricopeptide (TPR) repeat protein
MGPDETPRSDFRIPIQPRKKGHPDQESLGEEESILWVPPSFREKDEATPQRKKLGTLPEKASAPAESRNRRTGGKTPAKAPSPTRRRFFRSRLFSIASGAVAGIFLCWLMSVLFPGPARTLNPYPDPLQSREPAAEQSRSLEKALGLLREGNAGEALESLRKLEKASPNLPSLSYFLALAALQSGNTALAEKNADTSIAKRERIADSLALKAVIETQKPRAGSLGDPAAAGEALLRQATLIEPGNPAPLIELSTILRHKGDNDGALELLKAARNRLNPVDSHAVAETTIRLLELQALEVKNLPTNLDPDSGTSALFSAAYVAMRTGRFAEAASHLNTAKKRLPPDLFLYLVNDPALRRFKDQPELTAFFD